jgi:general secretion pathway protein A
MNLAYFGLRSDPFPDRVDPRFFFDTQASLASIAALRRSVKARRGILVFTGERGTGKTLVLKHMARTFEQTYHCLYTNQSYLPFEDLRSLVADGLGLPLASGSGPPDIQALNTRLLELHKDGEAAVVLLDEAQVLDTPTLCELEKLSPRDPASDRYLLQLILCGATGLEERLEKPEFQHLRERLAPPVRLGDLAPEEVAPLGCIERASRPRLPAGVVSLHVIGRGNPLIVPMH